MQEEWGVYRLHLVESIDQMRRSVYCCSSWDLVVIVFTVWRASEAAVEDDRSIVDDALLFLMFEVKEEAAAGGREGESKKHNGLIWILILSQYDIISVLWPWVFL